MSFFIAHRARISRSLVTVFILAIIQTVAAPVVLPELVAPKAEAATDTYTPAQATSWTVPANVTSITVTLKGGSAGVGGVDCGADCSSEPGGPRGVLTYTFNVSVGDLIGIYPGNKGVDGTSTRAGGADTTILGTFDGGDGGAIGAYGGSGQGGGGGAASVLAINGVIRAVAGGAGGGGGAGNVANSGFAGQAYDPSRVINNSYTGGVGTQPTPTTCAAGTQFDNNTKRDGGGGGGGGGGWFAGAGGGIYLLSNGECAGYGGSRGGNYLKDNSNVETIGTAGSSETVTATNGSIDITYTASTSFGTCSPSSTTDVDIYRVLKFTNVNSCTWTVPAGVTSIDFFSVGGGGGGGADGGSGGAGGGTISRSALAVTSGNSLTLTVGSGGYKGVFQYSNPGAGLPSFVSTGSSTFTSYGGGAGNQGPGNSVYPSGGITSNGTTAIGLQGGVGGLGALAGGSGTPGGRGSTNYFYGVDNQYAGGGAGGIYPDSSASWAAVTSFYGGGAGASSNGGVNTAGSDGAPNTGGGGGGGAANYNQTSGGRGADGVILIRYTINAADSFPSALSASLTYRFVADDYQTQPYVGKTWINSAGTTTPITTSNITGSPTIVNQSTSDGVNSTGGTKSVRAIKFTTSQKIKMLNLSTGYTLFHVGRYVTGGTNARPISAPVSWLSGFHYGTREAYHADWLTDDARQIDYKWLLSSDQSTMYRANGVDHTDNDDSIGAQYTSVTDFGINQYSGQESDFQLADVLVFNRELTIGEIRLVETYLSRIYGLSMPLFNTSESDTAAFHDSTYTYFLQQRDTRNDLNDTFTVEAWVKPDASCATGYCTLLAREASIRIELINGIWHFILWGDGNWEWVSTGVPLDSTSWRHIALVKSLPGNRNDSVKFYLDGQLVFTKIGSPYRASTTQVASPSDASKLGPANTWGYLGVVSGGGERYYGYYDEVKIWKTVRTQEQIAEDMHSNDGSNPLMQAYYNFNFVPGTRQFEFKIPNLAYGGGPRSDLFSWQDVPSTTYKPVAVEAKTAAYSIVTFPRTYITEYGGWKAPASIPTSSVLVVGGGGGGGGGVYSSSGYSSGGGGGGGSGGAVVQNVNLTAGTFYPVRVGVGGAGGTGGNSTYWGGFSGESGTSTSAFNLTANGGSRGGGGGYNKAGTYSNFTNSYGGNSGNGYLGGDYKSDSGFGGSGGGGATQNGATATNSAGASGGAGITNSYSDSATVYAQGGKGGNGSGTTNGGNGASVSANIGWGGNGGNGGVATTPGKGSSGSSGIVVMRWITASKPSYTKPTTAYLNAGMTETFTTNVAQDSATVGLTRTFKWESTTPTSNGNYAILKVGTGAANASYSWVPADTSTSGSGFLYRLTVTDSDTAGLFISDSSTAYAVINQALNVTGTSSIAKTINLARNETFTITLGTPTYKASLSPLITGITLDTSTAGYAVLKISDTATVGTWLETLTVTDSVSAVFNIPLTIKINAPPTLLNTSDIRSNNLILHLDAGNSQSLLLGDTTTATSAIWRDLSGNKKDASTGGATAVTYDSKTCTAPTYYSSFGGYLQFNGTSDCFHTEDLGMSVDKSFTVEAWYRATQTLTQAGASIFTQNSAGNIAIVLGGATSAGTTDIRVGMYNGTWRNSATGSTPVLNAWSHYVGTFDGKNFKLYLNGNLIDTTAYVGGLTSTPNTTGYFIGRRWDGSSYLAGSIASLRVYNIPMTDTEVASNFNATKYRFKDAPSSLLKPNQKYGVLTLESFTATSGGDTKTVVFSASPRQGVVWDTTSTPGQIKLSVGESLSVGTYYDTVTITDNFGASTYLPLTFTVTKADTITVTSGPSLTTVYSGSAPANGPIARVTGLVGVDTATVTTSFSIPCALGGPCSVGDLGPGGGRVFYISPTAINAATGVSDGGIYLELAPRNWNGNESGESGSSFATKLDSVSGTSSAIGTGAENTRLLRNALGDSATAATLAMNKTFKGLSDWFVPSYNELTTAITTLSPLGLGEFSTAANLWSSTQNATDSSRGNNAWSSNPPVLNTLLKTDNYYLRPIRAFSPIYPAETSTPVNVDTYTAKGSDLTFQIGALSNYQGVTYETSTLKITQANQDKLSINLYGAIAGSPFLIQTFGGSGPGAVTETVTAGGTATNCALSNHVLSNSSPNTVQVTCNIKVTKASSRNYFAESLDATVYFMLYVNNMPTNQVGSGSTIGLNGATSLTIDDSATVRAPLINSISISGTTVTINGEGFGSSAVSVKFERNVITSATPSGTDAAGIITVTLPAGARSGYVLVTLPSGAKATSPYLTLP